MNNTALPGLVVLCAGSARRHEAEQQEQQSHDTTHSQGVIQCFL